MRATLAGTPWKRLLVLAIASRLLFLFVGYGAVTVFGIADRREVPPPASENRFLDLPGRWDTGWYVGLASGGYRWDGAAGRFENIAFFPAYPLVLGTTARAFGLVTSVAWNWAGVALSTLLFWGALVVLWVFASTRIGRARADWCVVLCIAYPFAIFFGLPYSESLFLFSVCLLFLAFEREWYTTAGLAGLAAGLTRPTAVVAAIGLSVWWVQSYLWPTGSRASSCVSAKVASALAAVSPLLGIGIYSAFVYGLTGNPLMWAVVQEGWGRPTQNPIPALVSPLSALVLRPVETLGSVPEMVFNAAAGSFALASVWPIGRRLGWGCAAMVAVGVAMPLTGGGVASLGRYTSVLFPLYVWLAIAIPTRGLILLAGCFVLLQFFVAGMFFTWWPMY